MVPSTVSTFAKVKAPAPASTIAPAWVEDTSTLLFAANSIDPRVSVVFVAKLPPISPCAVNLMVLVPEVKSTALSSSISLIEPVVASKVRLVSEVIFPMVISPVEEFRLTTNVSSLPASAASTRVAIMLPVAVTITSPSSASTSVKVATPLRASIDTAPAD